jgi:predicted nucleic acid-binding protein
MLYFDTSFLTPIFRKEATSAAIEHFLQQQSVGELAISHWARVEFSSVLARDVRMGAIEAQAAIELDAQFEMTVTRSFVVLLPDKDDFDLCKRYLQRFDSNLRAGDALHLAIANNRDARAFYTLDRKLLRAGKLLGLPVATGIQGRT